MLNFMEPIPFDLLKSSSIISSLLLTIFFFFFLLKSTFILYLSHSWLRG